MVCHPPVLDYSVIYFYLKTCMNILVSPLLLVVWKNLSGLEKKMFEKWQFNWQTNCFKRHTCTDALKSCLTHTILFTSVTLKKLFMRFLSIKCDQHSGSSYEGESTFWFKCLSNSTFRLKLWSWPHRLLVKVWILITEVKITEVNHILISVVISVWSWIVLASCCQCITVFKLLDNFSIWFSSLEGRTYLAPILLPFTRSCW